MLTHVDFVISCCFVSLDTFFEFETADTGKTEALIVLLTDALVQHIQALFSDANIISATSDVLLQIRELYSTIERQQLKEFVEAIELLLEAKFEEVEAANPGKTVRVNLE